jgi:threonine dehydratase
MGDNMTNPTLTEIRQAAQRIRPYIHRTGVLTCASLDRQVGAQVFLKCENFQKVGAFKFRGACRAILSLSDEEAKKGVVTHSSGNHAQGVALASQLLNVKAVVVMPKSSPRIKLEATRSYGAEVVLCEDSSDDRERVARQLMKDFGYILIPPFDNDNIIAGQGTVVLEVARKLSSLDYLVVPVGGGVPSAGGPLPAFPVARRTPARVADDAQLRQCHAWRISRLSRLP